MADPYAAGIRDLEVPVPDRPPVRVRDAVPTDAAACAVIYRPYVEETAITFETTAPDDAELAARIESAQHRHAWLVAERDGEVIGYAYAGPLRARAAYDWSCETTVYLAPGRRRTGAGRALVTALLERLQQRGFRRCFAIIAVPNEASVGLHRALGFADAARLERVGWKLGAWHDVVWLQRDLGDPAAPPLPLV